MTTSLLALVALAQAGATTKPTANPLGFLYDLPAGWSVAATQGTFQVLKRPDQTENEIYIVGGTVDFEAKTSWDQRLQDEDEAMMKSLGPWSVSGEAKSFDAKGGKGMYRLYTGSNEGVDFHGEVWSLVAEKKRFGILAIFPKEMAISRYADFYAIAKSLRPDPSRKIETNNAHAKAWSQKLAGFKFVRSSAADRGSLNGSGGDAGERTFVFLADGTFQYFSHRITFISAGEFSANSESHDEASGTWSIQSDGKTAFLVLKPVGKPKETVSLKQSGEYILFNEQAFSRVRS